MRLLLVSQDFPPDVGGIETYAAELARRLSKRCERLTVVAPSRPEAAQADCSQPFPVRRVRGRRDLLGIAALPVLPALAYRGRFDVALHTQWMTAFPSLLARRLTGFPRRIAIAAHGRELLFQPFRAGGPSSLYDALRRKALAHADALLPVSRYTAGLLRACGAREAQVTVVPNGTDPQRLAPAPREAAALRRKWGLADCPVLLSLGRLVERKGFDTVIRALPKIVEAMPGATYLIAGTGPDQARLERLSQQEGVASRVRFLGYVPDDQLPALYTAADAFVMPSRQSAPDVEGFGIVFLEAAACGTPSIGARTGGIPDAILDGETGALVPPEAPQALAAACVRLLEKPGHASRLGEAARRRVHETHSWDRVAERLYGILDAAN